MGLKDVLGGFAISKLFKQAFPGPNMPENPPKAPDALDRLIGEAIQVKLAYPYWQIQADQQQVMQAALDRADAAMHEIEKRHRYAMMYNQNILVGDIEILNNTLQPKYCEGCDGPQGAIACPKHGERARMQMDVAAQPAHTRSTKYMVPDWFEAPVLGFEVLDLEPMEKPEMANPFQPQGGDDFYEEDIGNEQL